MQSSEWNRLSRVGDFRNTGQSYARASGLGCDIRSRKPPVFYCNWLGQVRASDAHRPAGARTWTIYWKNFHRKTMKRNYSNDNTQQRSCHPERSEGSLACSSSHYGNPEMFRFAQHDTIQLGD